MLDVVQLRHLDCTSHEIWTFVDELVLRDVLPVFISVVYCLYIGLDLSFDDPAQLVGDGVTILDLAVGDAGRRIQCIKDSLSTFLTDAVAGDIDDR